LKPFSGGTVISGGGMQDRQVADRCSSWIY